MEIAYRRRKGLGFSLCAAPLTQVSLASISEHGSESLTEKDVPLRSTVLAEIVLVQVCACGSYTECGSVWRFGKDN